MKNFGKLRWLTAVGLGMVLAATCACSDAADMADTKKANDAREAKMLRGNKVRIGHTTFLVPADAVFDLQPGAPESGNIPDKLLLYLDIPEMVAGKRPAWPLNKLAPTTLRVEISYRPGRPVVSDPPASADDARKIEALGLIELQGISPPQNTYSRNYSYLAKNPGIKSAKDAYFQFTCAVSWPEDPVKRNGLCRVGYGTPSGMLVEHFFQERQLKDWRVVLEETSQILVEYEIHN